MTRAGAGPRLGYFVVGVQKAGTTALYQKLTAHPEIARSPIKELHFFDNDKRDWDDPDYSALEAPFADVDRSQICGEATPVTLYWPDALGRLHQYNPAARLIVLLRDPVERALSHWKMERYRERETLDFGDAVSHIGRSRVRASPGSVHRIYSYVERGFYAPQIERLLDTFDRHQIFFATREQLRDEQVELLARLFRFLGVDDTVVIDDPSVVRPVDATSIVHVDSGENRVLRSMYRADIAATASLTGLDLSAWTDPTEPSSG